MQNQVDVLVAGTAGDGQAVAELLDQELAVAVYVSDWRCFERSLSLAEVERWAAQGLARLGPERLWKAAYRYLQAGPTAVFPGKLHRPRRFQACVDVVWRYRNMRQDQGFPRPAPSPVVYVDFPAYDGSVWSEPVSERDLECLARWGSPWQPPPAV